MASKQVIVAIAAALAVVAFLPALAAGTEHWVGDDKGWALDFDYDAWAESKQFRVGDTIVFKYNEPSHTVVEVGGADFAACSKQGDATVLGTGEDRVTLDTAGRRWFVCSVGLHCQNGMKLKINVLAADDEGAGAAPAPGSPSMPPPPPPSSPAGKVQGILAQAVVAVASVITAVLVF